MIPNHVDGFGCLLRHLLQADISRLCNNHLDVDVVGDGDGDYVDDPDCRDRESGGGGMAPATLCYSLLLCYNQISGLRDSHTLRYLLPTTWVVSSLSPFNIY